MVYKVKSKEDGKYYAVKKSKEKFKGVSDRKRKLEEVAKHEELPEHPNFVKFYRAWEEKQKLYMQIELCQMSLSAYATKNHEIPEDTIWKFLIDLLQAVKHLHDRYLVHMDIKPDNIFISFNGVCKLGDFGLMIDLNKDDLKEVQEGDPKYLAPEVLKGCQNITTAVDIFSLGMTILELATDLDLPRDGEAWHRLREGRLPNDLISSLSSELVQIMSDMVEPDHLHRVNADYLLSIVHTRREIAQNKRQDWNIGMGFRLRQFVYCVLMKLSCYVIQPFITSYRFLLIRLKKSKAKKTPERLNLKGVDEETSTTNYEDDLNQNKNKSNTTSTPKKNDLSDSLRVNLIHLNDNDEDLESNGKVIRNLNKFIKLDQNDYGMLNITYNQSENSSPLYNEEDSSSLSDLSDLNKSKPNKLSLEQQHQPNPSAEKKQSTSMNLQFSPTSISPSTNHSKSRCHIVSTRNKVHSLRKNLFQGDSKEISFNGQRLNFEDENEL